MERLNSVSMEPSVDRFRSEQVRQRSNWDAVADPDQFASAIHTITMQQKNGVQVTYVNALDPGDGYWLDNHNDYDGNVKPAGKAL